MRIILFTLLAAICLSTAAVAQIKAPKKVAAAFKTQFPYATKAKWSRNEENRYDVRFNMGDDKHGAGFDSTGHMMESSRFLRSIAEIPYPVSSAFEKEYPDAKIVDMAEVRRHTKDKRTDHMYEFNIRQKGAASINEVYYDEKGKEIEELEQK
jgi:hypothetical protein